MTLDTDDDDKIESNEKMGFFLTETSVNVPWLNCSFLFFQKFLRSISLIFGNMSVVDRFLHYTDIFYAHYMCVYGNIHT